MLIKTVLYSHLSETDTKLLSPEFSTCKKTFADPPFNWIFLTAGRPHQAHNSQIISSPINSVSLQMSHKYNEHEKRKNFNFPVAHVNGKKKMEMKIEQEKWKIIMNSIIIMTTVNSAVFLYFN